ncbi:MAG: thiol reductant ABC exporter subunit CydC [Acidimicrobiia bacterium]|nr:thiol reductant ABC exporter subunit CydC [Acidimicrobiia bacterium]
MRRRAVIRRLLSMMRPLAPLMAVSSACRVVNQGLGVAIPAVAAVLVVRIATGDGTVAPMAWMLVGLALVKGLFRYLEQFTGHAVAFRLLSQLRDRAYRAIEPLAPAGLEGARTGDLVARVIGDVDRVEPFYAHTIAPVVGAVAVPGLAAVALAVAVDPAVGLVFLPFPAVAAFAAPWVASRRVAGLAADQRRAGGEAGAILTDAVQGSRELAVLDARDQMANRIGAAADTSERTRTALARIAALRSGLVDLVAGAAVVAVALVATSRFDAGAIDVGAVAASIVVAWVGMAPARVLEDIVPDLEQALAAAGRLFDLADRRPPVVGPSATDTVPVDGSVAFEDVTVRIGDTTVLDGVDAAVPDRSFVAIVGPSGSGKSTLVELLVRFREPDRGRVLLGGADLRDLTDRTIRDTVALVPQRPELFYGSIGENLRLARSDATDADLWSVLERVGLEAWVRSLDDGLDAAVGELGDAMSGGQRQRLALARGLLREAAVLVVDEATSELDPASERRIVGVLDAERRRRTVVVVAHRLETITGADEILVVDGGRVAERGTHDELLERDGVYAGLWRRHRDVIDAG